MGCLGILVFLALSGGLMVAAWLCGLAEAKPPIDPAIGFRDLSGITGNCIGSDVSTCHRRSEGGERAKARSGTDGSEETSR